MTVRRLLLVAGLLTGISLAAVAFVNAGRWLVVADPLVPAEVILPLAGDRQRPAHAAELFLDHNAELFAITRLWIEPASVREWYVRDVARSVIERGVPEEAVVAIPGIGPTTYHEVANVRSYAESQGWSSLLAVTSSWHSRRARTITRRLFLDSEVTVSVRPAPERALRARQLVAQRIGPAARAERVSQADRPATGHQLIRVLTNLTL